MMKVSIKVDGKDTIAEMKGEGDVSEVQEVIVQLERLKFKLLSVLDDEIETVIIKKKGAEDGNGRDE